MTANRKKGDMILWSGAVILIGTVVLAVLILLGVIQPNIFPMTGGILDINSLSSGLLTFLLLIVMIYVGTRVLDFGLKYRRDEIESSQEK
ncbi:MAG: hypothetical protein ACTSRC_03200 [Candidatus Helarchaeota archaeon]